MGMTRLRVCKSFLMGVFDFLFRTEPNVDHNNLTKKELEEKTRRDVINQSDDLYNYDKHEECCELLSEYKEFGDVEVLWRIARAKYMMWESKRMNKAELMTEAFEAVSRALDIDDRHSIVHKWAAVLLDEASSLEGLAHRIKALNKVKEHLLKAAEIDPSDTIALYLLGVWCFQLADMPWHQRKIAATLFASPPESTYEEALEYFKRAEEMKPNFYSRNLLMLGKTYLKLGFVDRAKFYLNQAKEHIINLDSDLKTHAEAKEILEQLG